MAAPLAASAPRALLALGAALLLLLLAVASGQMTESETKKLQQECVEEIRQGAEEFDDGDHMGPSEKDQLCFQTCVLRKLGLLQNGEMAVKKPKNLATMPDDMYKNARRKCNPAVAQSEKCKKGMALASCLQKLLRSRRSVDTLLGL